MLHLCAELSLENLLFICSWSQVKKEICDAKCGGEVKGWMERLPSEFIPRCEAVSRFGQERDYLSMLHLLHSKYIASDAALEINISARQRRKITAQFDEEKVESISVDEALMAKGWAQLSVMYDRCAVEIWKLMNDSFARVQTTHKYEMWLAERAKRMAKAAPAQIPEDEATTPRK